MASTAYVPYAARSYDELAVGEGAAIDMRSQSALMMQTMMPSDTMPDQSRTVKDTMVGCGRFIAVAMSMHSRERLLVHSMSLRLMNDKSERKRRVLDITWPYGGLTNE